VPEPVVALALLGIGEDLVGGGGLLELGLSLGVAGVPVGVVLEGLLAVGLLDLLRAGRARHAQHLVVIA
jgi:hypothetical protein